ncbi:odorant receptor 157 [Lasius niger]|uniref:Odorant receptor 157 n=1 Tax=Lasius niger TaxID=67767 RepID=A0A0J7JYQ2_LASNI|nr:odorant receptor 157 [Lasius niger]
MKCLLEELQNIYNELTDENEINIIRKYGKYAKRYTAALILNLLTVCIIHSKCSAVVGIFSAPVLLLYPFWPYFFDILLSINESRSHPRLLSVTDLMVAILATRTILMVLELYAYGIFRIISYRIAQAMAVDALRKDSPQNKNLIYKKLIHAVDMHREAMK